MASGILKKFLSLSLEEKILNGTSLLALAGVFFPWVGGEWLGGKTITYSGLGFFTSFIGLSVLLLHIFLLLLTVLPLLGKPAFLAGAQKQFARFLAAGLAAVLTVAAWSVLTKFTFEFSRLQIHFGLYVTLVGSLVASLYAFLLYQEERKKAVHGLFHLGIDSHEDVAPPPPAEPEDHRIHL